MKSPAANKNGSLRPYNGCDGQYINGSWRAGRQGTTRKDTDPYSGETVAEIALAD